jgi:predicted nucleic acid-binding protein
LLCYLQDESTAGRGRQPGHEQHAGQLARVHALRGADAIHLASALVIGDPDLIVAVWDRHLHAGAQAAGLRVAPARLDL